MLSVKKILAGQGAVDYYLTQTRRGMADYYLPERSPDRSGGGRRLGAPAAAWWGGGAAELGLAGSVERDEFVPLYATGLRPDGTPLGRRFRLPHDATASKRAALAAADGLDDPYDRWHARHEVRRTASSASVAAWDCTFSPVKSVSLLWAAGTRRVRHEVWAAHLAAVDAGLHYLEQHAGLVRAGRNGVRLLEASGLVVARMNEWTSRDGDMQLHTHCVVLNRARTIVDGKWRALDGRALLQARTGAGAIYNRVLETELTRRLQVAWRDRPDGLRELEGVDDELIEAFSSRRRAITSRVQQLADAYQRKHGVPPPPAVLARLAEDATITTRRRKQEPTAEKALARWEQTARKEGRALSQLPRRVVGRARHTRPQSPDVGVGEVQVMLDRLAASGRPTFSRHDLLRAALDTLPAGTAASTGQLRQAADRLVEAATRHRDLIGVTAPDALDVPDELRRTDDSSIYERPARHRWALRSTLDQEAWLLAVATEPCGRAVDRRTIEHAGREHELGADQQHAVGELLATDRRIGLLIGPAGAGKTRTLRAVAAAWQTSHGKVIGLTVSQSAADVLSAEGQVRAENIAKWLFETRRQRWRLAAGALVVVDEASMVATADLAEIVEQARQAGGKVLLIGDPAQLAAIHIGGAFDLLADRVGASQLQEIRRFTQPWERHASLQLRRRDPAAIAQYAMRGRIHGGTLGQIEPQLFDAWRADALGVERDGRRHDALMIVATNEQAAVMGERARTALAAAGVIDTHGPTVKLRDNVASVGDHIVTRRNDRQLVTSNGRWVVNGDLWTILEVDKKHGAAAVRRHSDGATTILPADYLAEHAHLGYATTAHRAQGMTVDVCHSLVTVDASHELLYVAATRGRNANHLWVVVDSDRDLIRDDDDLPTPERVLSGILERRDYERLSTHQIIQDSQTGMTSLARIGAIYEDVARRVTEHWLQQQLAATGLKVAAGDRQWPSLVTKVRQLALAGHDLDRLLVEAAGMRPFRDAASVAGVLHWRLGRLAETVYPPRNPGLLAALAPGGGPYAEVAGQAAELIRQRWRQIRHHLATAPSPGWAGQLRARPADGPDRAGWLTAATAVAAYRERYEVADHIPLIGERPAGIRPDAQAAWDHAQLQVDRHQARRLDQLDDRQLADLDRRQQQTIAGRPRFDPDQLDQAHRSLADAERQGRTTGGRDRRQNRQTMQRARQHVARLEQAAAGHRRWRQAATQAQALRRQIALIRRRRQRTARTGARQ